MPCLWHVIVIYDFISVGGRCVVEPVGAVACAVERAAWSWRWRHATFICLTSRAPAVLSDFWSARRCVWVSCDDCFATERASNSACWVRIDLHVEQGGRSPRSLGCSLLAVYSYGLAFYLTTAAHSETDDELGALVISWRHHSSVYTTWNETDCSLPSFAHNSCNFRRR